MRLVADTLEALWNENLPQATEAYEKQRQADQRTITEEQREQIWRWREIIPNCGMIRDDKKRFLTAT